MSRRVSRRNAGSSVDFLLASALVNLNHTGITQSAGAISGRTNSGTGESDYSHSTVVGTAANNRLIASGAVCRNATGGGGYVHPGNKSFDGSADFSIFLDMAAYDWSELTGFAFDNIAGGEGFRWGGTGGTWTIVVQDASVSDNLTWTDPGLTDGARHTIEW